MTGRFVVDKGAIQGRVGIFDTVKGGRLVCFFFADKDNADAAPAMARVCADALNAVVAKRQGGSHVS